MKYAVSTQNTLRLRENRLRDSLTPWNVEQATLCRTREERVSRFSLLASRRPRFVSLPHKIITIKNQIVRSILSKHALFTSQHSSRTMKRDKRKRTVPPPPSSLIQLLQSDPAVLQYFQALQQSLEADVQIWKDRYQRLLSDNNSNAKVQTKKGTNTPSAKQSPKRKASKQHTQASLNKHAKETTAITTTTTTPSTTMEIDDSMFDDLSSDSSEDDEDHAVDLLVRDDEQDEEQPTHFETLQEETLQDDDPVEIRESQIWVEHAYHALGRLGISLTEDATKEEEVKERDDSNKEQSLELDNCNNTIQADGNDATLNDSMTNEITKESAPSTIRRSDKQVTEDIQRMMHTITRLYTETPEWGPFELQSDQYRPCWQCPGHPAQEASQLLFRSLLVMDTFCDMNLKRIFDTTFTGVGMHNRQPMVQMLLDSWKSHIQKRGPRTDRATLRETSVLVYNPEEHSTTAVQTTTATIIGGPKSLIRLAHVAERSWQSALLTQLYLSRNDVESAASLLMEYIQATLPSLQDMEQYPQCPPLLSLVVLESILNVENHKDWFFQWCRDKSNDESSLQHLWRTLSLVVAVCGWIWKQRVHSCDDRIHDTALVEFLCFQRLCDDCKSYWQLPFTLDQEDMWQASKDVGEAHLQELTEIRDSHCSPLLSTSMTMLRILLGTMDVETDESVFQPQQLLPKVKALRELRIRRQWPASKGDTSTTSAFADNLLEDQVSSFLRVLENGMQHSPTQERVEVLTTILTASHALADGRMALEAAAALVTLPRPSMLTDSYRRALDTFQKIAAVPVVRVINLRKRADRWQCFMNQASCQRLLVVRAVANLSDTTNKDVNWEFGGHAIDGTGPMVEAQKRLEQLVGSFSRLNKLVAPQWRPHDLKAFDRGAPNHESLVSTSMSEKACALSHIASWKGVLRSLALHKEKEEENPDSLFFRYPANMTRLLKIAGFAQGPPLRQQQQQQHHMPPTPVCVIVEDDAILVDDFTDRLQEVLNELPRDFHICWLGYSRPKSAPIVPYTKHVSIPTMLWYLTGYILSEAGAQYLCNALPVVGPVDSWMGLKTTLNWDNRFGVQVGLGTHGGNHSSSSSSSAPSPKELAQILQFRAYCAATPLVSQRVSDSKGSWRQFRDSDIEYSGVALR